MLGEILTLRIWNLLNHMGSELGWQSPLHTRSALNWYSQRPVDEGKTIQDLSFVLVWENEPVIAFLGAMVKEKTRMSLLAYEVPCIVIENNP